MYTHHRNVSALVLLDCPVGSPAFVFEKAGLVTWKAVLVTKGYIWVSHAPVFHCGTSSSNCLLCLRRFDYRRFPGRSPISYKFLSRVQDLSCEIKTKRTSRQSIG